MIHGSSKALFLLTAVSLAFQTVSARTIFPSRSLHIRDDDVVPQLATTDATFSRLLLGPIQPGSNTAGCEDFAIEGPFESFHLRMGQNTVRGLTVKTLSQNETTIVAGAAEQVGGVEVAGGDFVAQNNERITAMALGVSDATNTVRTIAFTTNLGTNYKAISEGVRKGDVNGLTFQNLPVGSGILARIYGTSCSTGEFGSIGFDILNELNDITITNIDYEGFSNNIMPADHGTPMSVGNMIVDATNSSTEQRVVMTTSDAITYSRTIKIEGTLTIGQTYTVGGKVGIPLVSEGSVTIATTWSLSATLGKSETTEATTTRGANYWIYCPAGKICTAAAFITTYQLTINMEATFTATTKTGGAFMWMQKGTYDTADSQTIQFNVTEIDPLGNAVPSTVAPTTTDPGASFKNRSVDEVDDPTLINPDGTVPTTPKVNTRGGYSRRLF